MIKFKLKILPTLSTYLTNAPAKGALCRDMAMTVHAGKYFYENLAFRNSENVLCGEFLAICSA